MGLTKVSTDGVKDNTINTAKIINGAIQTEDIADNQIRTDKILDGEVTLAKLPHGTSSNDGKFLRANNGADPTFESIPAGITINNQADNRVITATGTTDTLNAESSVVIDANGKLGVGTTSPNTILHVQGSNNNGELEALRLHNNNTGSQTKTSIGFTNTNQADYEHARIVATRDNAGRLDFQVGGQSHTVLCVDGYASGVVGVNTDQASKALDVNGEIRTNTGILFGSDTAAANRLDDYEEGTWTPANDNFDTYSNVTWDAKYTKIGNLVFINAEMTAGTIDWSTYDRLSGLPFAVIETAAGSWTTNGPAAGGEILLWDNEYVYFANDFYGPSSHRVRFSGFYITNQ